MWGCGCMCVHVEVCNLAHILFRICPRVNSYPEWYYHFMLSFSYLLPIFNRILWKRRVQNYFFLYIVWQLYYLLWLPSGIFSVRIFHKLQQLFVEVDGIRMFLDSIHERGRWDKDEGYGYYRMTNSILGINFLNYSDNFVINFGPHKSKDWVVHKRESCRDKKGTVFCV